MKKSIRGVVIFLLLVAATASLVFADTKGTKKKRALAHDYGNVVISNYSEKNHIAPVVFKHWLHRSKYTCRLCHVDLGFAMEANGTKMKEDDNRKGFYCGTCHNGKESFSWETRKFGNEIVKNCDRCHSYGKDVHFENEFGKYTAGFPRERFGNGINWEKAEENGTIKLKDFIEGVSIKRKPMTLQPDTDLKAKMQGMPDIIFSHKKHAVWNGCELCHPEIFDVKKGGTKYSMSDIFTGKYCGVCHEKVAFPNTDCQRCHTKPV